MTAVANLPPGWALARIEDIAEVTMGQSPPGSTYNVDGRGVPFFQGKAEFGDMHPTVRKWTTATAPKLASAGSILMSVRAPVGPTNVTKVDCAIGRGLAAITPRHGVDRDYVLWALRATEGALAVRGAGSTFDAISGQQLRDHIVPLAPSAEQRRIVERLGAHHDAIKEAQQDIRSLRMKLSGLRLAVTVRAVTGLPRTGGGDAAAELAQMQTLRTDSRRVPVPPVVPNDVPLPTGWIWASVSQLAASIDYGTSHKAAIEPCDGLDVPVLRMGNIQDGEIDFSGLKYVPTDIDGLPKLLLRDGDLLFNRTNSAELVGKCAVFSAQDGPYTFASYLIRCRFLPGVRPEWVSLVINSPLGRAYIRSVASQQVGQANVNGTKLAAMPIPLPPLATQDNVLTEVSSIVSTVKSNQSNLAALDAKSDALWRSVLRCAYRGGLETSDEGDEPAELLLKLIAEERGSFAPAARGRRPRTVPAAGATTSAEESA